MTRIYFYRYTRRIENFFVFILEVNFSSLEHFLLVSRRHLISSKILKPVIYLLRKKDFLSVVYLEDFLLIASPYDQCMENILATSELLTSLGFLINRDKSVLVPARSCRFLSFIFDTDSFSVSIPPDKRNRFLQLTLVILKKKSCKIRFLASYIDSLISVCPAVQYGILHTKILEREKFFALLRADGDFEDKMPLPLIIREDLLWWRDVFTDTSQRNVIRSGVFRLEIFTDASLTGWGLFVMEFVRMGSGRRGKNNTTSIIWKF